MSHILTPAQAKAVYDAMQALNNVNAVVKASFPLNTGGTHWVHVAECGDTGDITITWGLRTVARYSSQSAFAIAYGLN